MFVNAQLETLALYDLQLMEYPMAIKERTASHPIISASRAVKATRDDCSATFDPLKTWHRTQV